MEIPGLTERVSLLFYMNAESLVVSVFVLRQKQTKKRNVTVACIHRVYMDKMFVIYLCTDQMKTCSLSQEPLPRMPFLLWSHRRQ